LAGIVLVLLLVGCFMVMKPFISALLWSIVLCFCLWPLQRRFTALLRGRRTLSAAITTMLVALLLVVPFIVIGVNLADDARELHAATRKWIEAGPPAPPSWLGRVPFVGNQARSLWIELAQDSVELLERVRRPEPPVIILDTNLPPVTSDVTLPPIAETAAPATSPTADSESKVLKVLAVVVGWARTFLIRAGLAVGHGLIEVTLSVFLTFFLLRDGAALAERLSAMVGRIAGEQGWHLLEVAGGTVRGVVYGILGTALVQGGVAGIGFLIAGVPGAALLGLLTFFLSIIPMGPPLVWIPAVIWLFRNDSAGWGIFMLIWGLGVSSIDNIVKPWLISQGSNMTFILIFFGVLGGALAFGFIGVFLGPTLLAVAYRLIEEWSRTPPAVPEPRPNQPLSPGADMP
jgi:predicted PurR-regulated permease PerM